MFAEKINPQKISQGRKVANVKREMCKLGIKNMQFKTSSDITRSTGGNLKLKELINKTIFELGKKTIRILKHH